MLTSQSNRRFWALQFSCFILFLTSCAPVAQVPSDPTIKYPQRDRIDLKVQLYLSDELANAYWKSPDGWDNYNFHAGHPLAENSEILARALFSEVFITNSRFDGAENKPIDAVLIPRIVLIDRTRPALMFQEQTTSIELEWTLKDLKGDIIWIDIVTGEGKGRMGNPARKSGKKAQERQVQAVMRDLFLKSFDEISSSVEIRNFSDSH